MTGPPPCLRRTLLRVALAATATLAANTVPVSGAEASQSGYDYDCTDFESRTVAQAFYEEIGGPVYDPYNLDDDGDGVACEEWVRGYDETEAGGEGINGRDGIDRDCADFASHAAAQRYYLTDGGLVQVNIDHLDPNRNGIACEAGEPG